MAKANMTNPSSAVRDRLLSVAARMFYRHGIANTGIDSIIAAAEVSKMSLYRHFGSKDALVAECLEAQDRRYHDWFVQQVESQRGDPMARLLSIFDVLDRWFHSRGFRGCAFINAAVELAGNGHPAKQWVIHHKQSDRAYMQELAVRAEVPEPAAAARQLMLLAEGAIITALVQDDLNAARDAKEIARRLFGSAGARSH